MVLMQKISRLEGSRASSSFDVTKKRRNKGSVAESSDDVKSKFKIHQYTDGAITRNNMNIAKTNVDIKNATYFERSIFAKSPSAIEVSLSQAQFLCKQQRIKSSQKFISKVDPIASGDLFKKLYLGPRKSTTRVTNYQKFVKPSEL